MAKHILYLHETALIAGAENSLLLLASRLDRSRFVPVFVLGAEGPLATELRGRGITVLIQEFPRIRGLKGVLAAVKRLRATIREHDAALIHSNSIRTHLYGYFAAGRSGIPLVWHQRNLLEKELIDPDRFLSFMPRVIICNSSAIARRFRVRGGLAPKVRVVFNGVDTELFNPGIAGAAVRRQLGIGADERVVGIASRFNEHKGHEVFFRAAAAVLKEFPGTRFLVAGGAVFEPDRKRELKLRELVAGMGMGDRVVFSGYRRDMPQVYAAMDVVVLASAAEACGRVALEAMAAGKALVATASGGTVEMIRDGENGLLFAPGDSPALAGQVVKLLSVPGLASRLGNCARESVEKYFSARKNVRQIEDIYGELTHG